MKGDEAEADDEMNGEAGNNTEDEDDNDTKDDGKTTITEKSGEGEGIGKEGTVSTIGQKDQIKQSIEHKSV